MDGLGRTVARFLIFVFKYFKIIFFVFSLKKMSIFVRFYFSIYFLKYLEKYFQKSGNGELFQFCCRFQRNVFHRRCCVMNAGRKVEVGLLSRIPLRRGALQRWLPAACIYTTRSRIYHCQLKRGRLVYQHWCPR